MIWFLRALVASVGLAATFFIVRRNKRLVHPTPESLVIRLEDDIPDRFIELEGVVNFRDVGGYKTTNSQRVRRGLVFRSGGLMRLTDGDVTRLDAIGFKLICDLRGKEEVAKEPDRLPAQNAPEYLHLPLTMEDDRRRRLWALMTGPNSVLAYDAGYVYTDDY